MLRVRGRGDTLIGITLALIAALLFAGGCGITTPPTSSHKDPAKEGALVAKVSKLPALEGNAVGYPTPPWTVGGAEVYMVHNGTHLQVLITAEAGGWVSVGFNEKGKGMDGASLILGTTEGGVPLVRNDLGRGWSHSAAAGNGIVDAVIVAGEDKISLEFIYPFVLPEGFRLKELVPGEFYTLLVAYNTEAAELERKHNFRGTLAFSLEP